MSKIDYQALRDAAERAIPAMERLLMLPVDDDLISEQELKDYGVDIDALNAFKFLTGPETVLALLDERERNQQYIKRRDQENEDIALTVGKLRVELEHYKSREERVTKLVLDNSTSWDVLYEKLEAAEKRIAEQREYYEGVIADGSKRIAELESNEVREVGNQFLVVRHPGKTPAIKHCTGDLEEFLRKLIEQDPLVTIDIITHRYYGVGGQWVQDTGEYLQMMQGAGIGVKGE
ncbi:ead/Ea22-like family protein [Salmonella enterica]|nr:ead/Ea22-like family protein [Salmonella enterica]ECZ4386159.1 ead/Ea22-like family protein [Salmonella enterica]EEF9433484.1 ead/Ea22-like family protein [Salmonella enterica]EFQ2113329.1 ead/Ea22-like family protein [Salmonella enterica]EJT8963901.1 ead/Ea22-like family protein [Salmonella enterica]